MKSISRNRPFFFTCLSFSLMMLAIGPFTGLFHQENSKRIKSFQFHRNAVSNAEAEHVESLAKTCLSIDPTLEGLRADKLFNHILRDQSKRNTLYKQLYPNIIMGQTSKEMVYQAMRHKLQLPPTVSMSEAEIMVWTQSLGRTHGHIILIGSIIPLMMCVFVFFSQQLECEPISDRSLRFVSNTYILSASSTVLLMFLKGLAIQGELKNGVSSIEQLENAFIGNPIMRGIIYGLTHTATFVSLLYFIFKVSKSLNTNKDISEKDILKKKNLMIKINAVLWVGVGIMLIYRGILLFPQTNNVSFYLSLLLGAIIGGAKGFFVLSKVGKKNIFRIEALEKPVLITQAISLRLLILIPLMILFGLTLRYFVNSIPGEGYTVGAIYVGIGAALMISSRHYWGTTLKKKLKIENFSSKLGILIVNLGSPAEPTVDAVHNYLNEFLSDPKVIKIPRIKWLPILKGIVLPFRAPKSAELYKKIWTPEGSPLIHTTKLFCENVQKVLGDQYDVQMAMRYGDPSLESEIIKMAEKGIQRIQIIPAFPQYSDTTTGSIEAEVQKIVRYYELKIVINILKDYATATPYIDHLVAQIESVYHQDPVDKILVSFHGIPLRYAKDGDSYPHNCEATFKAIQSASNINADKFLMSYQSRFGPEEWLKPYTDETMIHLAKEKKSILVLCPGFLVDCLETIDEIDRENRNLYESNGGPKMNYLFCLNDDEQWCKGFAGYILSDTKSESLA